MTDFEKIVENIKTLKIQGARNIALQGLKAMKIKSDISSLKKLIKARPTEPCLFNAIRFAKETSPALAYNYLTNMDKRVELISSRLVKNKDIVFTHCHSTTVTGALKKQEKE